MIWYAAVIQREHFHLIIITYSLYNPMNNYSFIISFIIIDRPREFVAGFFNLMTLWFQIFHCTLSDPWWTSTLTIFASTVGVGWSLGRNYVCLSVQPTMWDCGLVDKPVLLLDSIPRPQSNFFSCPESLGFFMSWELLLPAL